jgi:hypothetical protein
MSKRFLIRKLKRGFLRPSKSLKNSAQCLIPEIKLTSGFRLMIQLSFKKRVKILSKRLPEETKQKPELRCERI